MERSIDELLRLVESLESAHECRNLMGRFVYYNATFRNPEILPLWSEREDSRIEMPWGWYGGQAGIADFLEEQGDRADPSCMEKLPGVMQIYELDTELVEVAEDGQTAKGVWTSPCQVAYIVNWAAVGEWRWCRYAVDFINEDEQWKLWKMRVHPLFRTNYYRSWTREVQAAPERNGKAIAKDYVDWQYSPEAVYPADYPELPRPYKTYTK